MDSKDFKKIWPIKQEMNMATDSDDMSTTYESELSSDEYGDFRIPKLEIKKEIGSDDDSYPMWTRTSTNIPLKFPGRYYDKSSWTRRWSDELVIHLISFYRAHPVLWNTSHPNYKNKRLKDSLIQEFSKSTDIPEDEVRKKWNNLRTQFSKERTKVKASMKTGSGADDMYTPSWMFYNELQFLDDSLKHRASCTTMTFMYTPSTNVTGDAQSTSVPQEAHSAANVSAAVVQEEYSTECASAAVQEPYFTERCSVPEDELQKKRKVDSESTPLQYVAMSGSSQEMMGEKKKKKATGPSPAVVAQQTLQHVSAYLQKKNAAPELSTNDLFGLLVSKELNKIESGSKQAEARRRIVQVLDEMLYSEQL